MARALATGWGEPVICTDAGSGRARLLAEELGGRAVSDNLTLAREATLVVLCHKPAQLKAVAREIDGQARAVVSILSGVTLDELKAAYPRTPILRFAVNLPVEARLGTVCFAGARGASEELEAEVLDRFSRLGLLVRLEESLIPCAIALSGVGPAYLSLVLEAQVDAAEGHGLTRELAAALALQTMAGTAVILHRRGSDLAGLRKAVASPGGPTEMGVATLERAGLRQMFGTAFDAVVAKVTDRS